MTALSAGLPIISGKRSVDLTRAEAQTIMDFEVFSVGLGLGLSLLCRPCRRAGLAFEIAGEANEDYTKFSVDCACTDRTYRGALSVPMSPPPVAERARHEDGSKRIELLTRDQMLTIKAFDQLCIAMKFEWAWRCMRCKLAGEDANGVTGAAESTDSLWIAECECTRREYHGADAIKGH